MISTSSCSNTSHVQSVAIGHFFDHYWNSTSTKHVKKDACASCIKKKFMEDSILGNFMIKNDFNF